MHKKVLLIIIFVLFILSIVLATAYSFDYAYPVTVTKIHDGDTFTCDIDMGLGLIMKNQRIRVLNCDAYELKVPELGDKATSFTKAFLFGAKDNLMIITTGKRDSFGRVLAQVINTNTGASLADELTSNSLITGKWRKDK